MIKLILFLGNIDTLNLREKQSTFLMQLSVYFELALRFKTVQNINILKCSLTCPFKIRNISLRLLYNYHWEIDKRT